MTTMYSKLTKKAYSISPFKLALNNSSSRPSSRLPTFTTSCIRSVSSKGEENVAPFSLKRVSDDDWEAGLVEAKMSTPKKKNINRFSQAPVSCAESTFDISSLLANRHNNSIEVARKRLARPSFCDNEADITLDMVPDSLTEFAGVQYIEPVEDFSDNEAANKTFDLSEMLNQLDAPQERLVDGSLSDLMNVEINYSLEFPNTAIGRAPHISVCQFKRDKKRAAQRALDNLVHHNCIIDVPLQDLAPSLKWKVLTPEQYKAPVQNIPILIVTPPSDGNLVKVKRVKVDYDREVIASGSYKNFLLDASFYNWTIRFGEVSSSKESRKRASRAKRRNHRNQAKRKSPLQREH